MQLKNVLKQIKPQTLVGWTSGYLAAIVFNAAFGGKFDNVFWFSVSCVLLVRMAIDFVFAMADARQKQEQEPGA